MNVELTEKEEEVLEQIYEELSKPTKTEFKVKWIAKKLGVKTRGLSPIIYQLDEKGLVETVTNTRNSNAWTANKEEVAQILGYD